MPPFKTREELIAFLRSEPLAVREPEIKRALAELDEKGSTQINELAL